MAGKGDRMRKVDGDKYRSNYDSIKWVEGLRKDLSKLIFHKDYPDWICNDCGRTYGKRPEGNPYGATYHVGTCDICGEEKEVTEPRDFGHMRKGWKPEELEELKKDVLKLWTPDPEPNYETSNRATKGNN